MADQSDMVLLNNVVFLLTCSFELPVPPRNLQVTSEKERGREGRKEMARMYKVCLDVCVFRV